MFTGAAAVYLLCLGASVVCAWLLVRSYLHNRTSLLLWSAACFICLALNNLAVVVDILILPQTDLSTVRVLASLVGVSMLLFGFIWEADRVSTTVIFLSGMATMGFVVAGLFFLRFWRRTHDPLFLTFGIAFWLLAINQAVIALSGIPREELNSAYILRIIAFGLLIIAILAKNLGDGKKRKR